MLQIFNTLSGKKELFKPRKSKRVDLFVCGPTVYNFIHLGNARTYLVFDIVVRYLRQQGYEIRYLQNITDIDDRIIERALRERRQALELAREFEAAYYQDMERLGIRSVSKYARATDYIPQIVSQVRRLVAKGHVYRIEEDGYYFDLATFADYGKLARRTTGAAEDGVSRIDESVAKRNRGDFCVWKFSKIGEPSWDTELGAGRPGWHIEDTAITESEFGDEYDLHGAARDLIFPHHEAEIAQMRSLSGKSSFVRCWMHVGLLQVEGVKMSKSLGNFTLLRDFLTRHEPAVFRMLVASSHYRSSANWTEAGVQQAVEQLRRLRGFADRLAGPAAGGGAEDALEELVSSAQEKFHAAMADDFNTPEALAVAFELLRQLNPFASKGALAPGIREKTRAFLKDFDDVFGFQLDLAGAGNAAPPEIQQLAREREKARRRQDWQRADELRSRAGQQGWLIEDTATGPRIKRTAD